MPNDNESEILFTVRTLRGRLRDGVTRLQVRAIDPRLADGTPLFPPKVPPRPPSRSLIAGYIEHVEVGGVPYTQIVIDVQNEAELDPL